MLDGRFLSDAMAPDDLLDYESRGAVVHRFMPLMRESGYRDRELEILGLSAIQKENGVWGIAGLRRSGAVSETDPGRDAGLRFHRQDEDCSNYQCSQSRTESCEVMTYDVECKEKQAVED